MGDEQPLAHELPGRAGRADDVPLCVCCRTSSTTPWRRSGSASSAASRLWSKKAWGAAPSGRPLLELDTPDVIVTSIKPSDDGKATIVRLFAAAGRPAKVGLKWGDAAPKQVFLSNLAEEKGKAVTLPIDIPAWGIVTLRVE